MIFCIDTSVVVRLLVGEPVNVLAIAEERLKLEHQRGALVYATDVVIVESYYAMKHHYECDPAEIRGALQRMLESGLVAPEPGSGVLAALADQAGSAGFADRVIHHRHRELGAVTLTFDEAQGKLAGAEYMGK